MIEEIKILIAIVLVGVITYFILRDGGNQESL